MGAKRLDRRVSDRYKLPDDAKRDGRVGRGHPIAHIHKAEIYDVSYAGIAFRIASDIAPQIGEVVAVEFTLPKYSKMAWYAQVMRVEIDHSLTLPDNMVVLKAGAKFLELPHARRKLLESHIDDLLSEVHSNLPNRISILTDSLRVQRSYESGFLKLIRGFIVFVSALIVASWFIHHMSEIGSSKLRTSGPPIWPGYREHAPTTNPWRTPPEFPDDNKRNPAGRAVEE
jgi:hypothetical protein